MYYNKKVILFTVILITALIIVSSLLKEQKYHNTNGFVTVSSSGLQLLNNYEGTAILDWEYDIDGNKCLTPFYLGDGVVTFGHGITFNTIEDGYDEINLISQTDYVVGDCILEQDLDLLQLYTLSDKKTRIMGLDKIYRSNITQNEFDAIMILYYLNEESVNNEYFWKSIVNKKSSKEDFIDYFIKEYSQFDQYDIYKDGWNNRIKDAAEVFYDKDYQRNY